MMFDYFYGQSGELFAYFRIPKALFQDSRFRQLSTDARTLYGILLDRMSLSAKNSWVDEHGRVYIIYTVREVQESLCCAEHKAVKLFRELEQADLIERKRRGLGRPSLIYVKNFSSGLPKAQIQNCANSNSCAAESAVQVRPKSQSNNTDGRHAKCALILTGKAHKEAGAGGQFYFRSRSRYYGRGKEKRARHCNHQKRNSAQILSSQLYAPANGRKNHTASGCVAEKASAWQ